MAHLPLLVFLVATIALLAVVLGLSWLIGARTRRGTATDIPFESGIGSAGGTGGEAGQLKVAVDFYLIAIFFVIFDLEAVFIFSWAIAVEELGWPGYLAIAAFILELLLALVYAVRTGVFDFGQRRRELPRADSLLR
jgi:NADH-quinone oxidoreductase subunit A